ncbi:hypothetical protein GGR57DRAFT_76514 [Xylariaceae sp. FL1272]|nr:hypothetical protein GGR57DRAFT_76514 [Xylariaceae sp. FL1272]
METGESGTRQSGFTSASRPDLYSQGQLEAPRSRDLHEIPNMAAAALLNPAAAYRPHHQTFSPSYHHAQAPPAVSNIMSSGESKRPPTESETVVRQSLPSISEVFSAAKPSPYTPSIPTTLAGSQNLPHPFASNVQPPRTEPVPEPRSLPAHDDKFFRYPPRPELSPSSQAPPPSYSIPDQRETLSTLPREPSTNHANPQHPASVPYPPGQLPLSAPQAVSQHHPSIPPYDPHRLPAHADDEYGLHRTHYNAALNRQLQAMNYKESLQKVAWNARTICNFAEAYAKIASEQQHAEHTIPERLPTEREVSEIIDVTHWLKQQLESLRENVATLAEKARDNNRNSGPGFDGEDDIMYGDGVKPPYGLGEVKKRRGRAAPPGRCHSCNRIDTPEWRRGPDGARTLCNACGLHYAKLERKRQMEQRSIRPKVVEERS